MKKSNSLKKRHTKPCKFFQTNRCPHAADVCDFAHVIADPYGGIPFDPSLHICRYYYSGHCANGNMCRYRHESQLPAMHTETYPLRVVPNSVADWAATASAEATYPDSPSLYSSPPAYIQTWAPSAYASMNPAAHTRSPDSAAFGPSVSVRSRDSVPSLDATSTTTTATSSAESADDVVFATTSDPKYIEHTHSHQSQVCILDDAPLVHVPPFRGAPLIPFPLNTHVGGNYHQHGYPHVGARTPTNGMYEQRDAYGAFGLGASSMVGGKTPTSIGSRMSPSSKSLKQKTIKYKTKPCKFFPTEKGCPNGVVCNFIHDDDPPVMRMDSPPPLKSPSSDVKEKEAAVHKDFVPIPWRVIGGGVRLSAHNKTDEGGDQVSYKFDATQANDCSLPSRPPQLNLLPIKIVSRQRSNSIPSTPSIAQIKAEHLFSAESPGVL